ncbi:MAG: signal peptidase II [Caulobacterales bacterium]
MSERALPRLDLVAYVLAVVVIALDQAVKYWIVAVFHLPERVSEPLVGPLRLTMVWNDGVSFGFLRGHTDLARWGLVAFSLAVSIALAIWARRVVQPILAAAIGMIMGGAVGNVIDRVRFGAVVDFIDASALHFPWVFNVADSAINIGVGLLLLDALMAPRKRAPA